MDGIRIGELLPLLAKQADKYSIIRSMTHGNNGHETASYMVQTGRHARRPAMVYPCVGAVVSLFKGYDAGYKGLIPPYIVLTEPQGRFSEAGFLGSRYKPFATGGDPAQDAGSPWKASSPRASPTSGRRDRRELLHKLEHAGARAAGRRRTCRRSTKSEEQAYDLILGDAGKVFDLSQEKDELRDRYGRNTFGQSCLMARRLVERGVPYVTINYNGWDTHKQTFPDHAPASCRKWTRAWRRCSQDLSDRGLLDSTIVWWSGEFGRTPKVQWEAPGTAAAATTARSSRAVVAGGGFKGGHVVGASDAKGEEVKERPVYPVRPDRQHV